MEQTAELEYSRLRALDVPQPHLNIGVRLHNELQVSYDLLLVHHPGSPAAPSLEFFRARPHYTVSDTQATYENPDTNVYFDFETTTPDTSDPEAVEPEGTWLALNLNLYRPSVFGLEAARELAAVTAATDSDVFDLQAGKPDVRPFDPDAFLERWNDANVKAHQALLAPREGDTPMPPPRTLPGQQLRAVWEWNVARQQWNDQLGADVFVPRVFLLDAGERVETAVVWTDAMPAMLPRVDRVLVYRDALRPKRWAGRKQPPDLTELTWAELAPHLAAPVTERSLAYYDVRSPADADALRRLIAGRASLQVQPKGLALDQVHDRELLPVSRGQSP